MSAQDFYGGQKTFGQDQSQPQGGYESRGYDNGGYNNNNNNGPSYPMNNSYGGDGGGQQPQYAPPPQGYSQNHNNNNHPQTYTPPPPKMQSSAPYAEPQYVNPPNGTYNPNNQDLSGKANPSASPARFTPKRKLNDPIFLVLFVAVFAGFVVVAALAIRQFVIYNGGDGGFGDSNQGGTGISTSLN